MGRSRRWALGGHTPNPNRKGKLAYAVTLGIAELCRSSKGIPVFATFTFRENITDKAEASKRWRRLKERLRRGIGARSVVPLQGVGVWQRQKRGAWHLHYVFNQFLGIVELREAAEACGFGPMLNLRFIKKGVNAPGLWKPQRVVSYMVRYLTRDLDDQDKHVRAVDYLGTRRATTSFGWANGFAKLYRAGRAAWSDLYAEDLGQPCLDNYWFIIRLGWEVMSYEEKSFIAQSSDAVKRWWDPKAFPF